MKRSLQETNVITDTDPSSSPVGRKTKRENKKWKRAKILLLSIVAFYLCFTIARSFRNTDAITLPEPIGIVYFVDDPSEELIAHENYHLNKQIEDEGAFLFYLKYILGRGCIYEVEAGEDLEHTVCEIPWMAEPKPEQIVTEAEIVAWYESYLRTKELAAAKQNNSN